MKLHKITISDFRWFKGTYTFDFCTEKNKPADVVVIYAPNGSGKTSFTEAIEWTFSGKIERIDTLLREFKSRKPREGYILKNRDSANVDCGTISILLSNGDKSCTLNRATTILDKRRNNDYSQTKLAISPEEVLSFSSIQINNWILSQSKINEFLLNASAGRLFQGLLSLSGRERDLEFYYGLRDRKKELISRLDEIKERVDEHRTAAIAARNSSTALRQQLESGLANKRSSFVLKFAEMVNPEFLEIPLEGEAQDLEGAQLFLQSLRDDLIALDAIKREIWGFRSEWIGLRRGAQKRKQLTHYIRSKTSLDEQLNALCRKEAILQEFVFLSKNDEVLTALAGKNAAEQNELQMTHQRERVQHLLRVRADALSGIRRDLEPTRSQLQRLQTCRDEASLLKRNYGINPFDLTAARQELLSAENAINFKELLVSAMKRCDLKAIDPESSKRYGISSDIEELHRLKEQIEKIDVEVARLHRELIDQENRSEQIATLKRHAVELVSSHELDDCPVCDTNFGKSSSLLDAILEITDDTVSALVETKKSLELARASADEAYSVRQATVRDRLKEIALRLSADLNGERDRLQQKRADLQSAERLARQVSDLMLQMGNRIDETSLQLTISPLLDSLTTQVTAGERIVRRYNFQLHRLRSIGDSLTRDLDENRRNLDAINCTLDESGYSASHARLMQELALSPSDAGARLVETRELIAKCRAKVTTLEQQVKTSNPELFSLSEVDGETIESYERRRLILLEERRSLCRSMLSSIQSKLIGLRLLTLQSFLAHLEKVLFECTAVLEYLVSARQLESHESRVAEAEQVIATLQNEEKGIRSQVRIVDMALKSARKFLSEIIKNKTNISLLNDIYRLIDPNLAYRRIMFELDMSKGKESIFIKSIEHATETIRVNDAEDEVTPEISPALFFSEAQSNVLSISLFLTNLAKVQEEGLGFLVMDDPVQSMDDINAYAFVDMCRIYAEKFEKQLIITTHDFGFFELFRQRFPSKNFNFKYFELTTEVTHYQ